MRAHNLDHFDAKLLECLQVDSSLSQRELAERVGLSQNACWRRLQALRNRIIKGYSLRLDQAALGLDITAFVLIRTRHHSKEWLRTFHSHVKSIPEVIDFYRLAGDFDYMLKVIVPNISEYDRIYQVLIEKLDIETVTSYFSMETLENNRPIPLRKTGA